MSLDLLGAIPTPAERAARCDGRTPGEMADAFLAAPEFARNEVRFWVVRLREDPMAAFAGYLVAADEIIRMMARGEIGYDGFAARILAHPAVTLLRDPRPFDPFIDGGIDTSDRSQIGAHAIRTFLGRAPLGDEAADLGNLFRVWTKTLFIKDFDFYWHAVLDPALCNEPLLGAEACTSHRFGATVTVNPPLPEAVLYEDLLGSVPAELQEQLERPGKLLATRREFWDESADYALTRFTGWWRSSLDQTDTDLPEVREALATWFRATPRRDIRELYREILTSLLYRTTADADSDLPPWARGPTKSMTAEQWLDSAARGFERDLGSCDPHTDEPRDNSFFFPIQFRDPGEVVAGFDYFFFGQLMGGCAGMLGSADDPGLKLLGTHDLLSAGLCAQPPVPVGHDPSRAGDEDVERLVAFQIDRLLGRGALPDELAAAVQAGRDCRGDSTCDTARLAAQFCAGILRSATYFYY